MHLFGKLVHIFGKLAHIFGKFVHIPARKLVSRTSKQVSRNLGPLWQPGVYNDTKVYRRVQNHYKQTFFPRAMNSNYRYRIVLLEAMTFHYRDRSVEISAEYLSLQIQILPVVPISLHYRYRFRPRNELIL